MSGFANPFAQFGDYRSDNVASDSPVTTSYLTGLPDPKTLADDRVSLNFKQLLKRDVRTKQRALLEFSNWLDGQATSKKSIDDSVHLAYIQIYAKLSLENSPGIRAEAHSVLGKMYRILGKASSKYLKYSVGPWWTARFDPDVEVVKCCENSLSSVFPGEKQKILFERFKPNILEYIYDACARASAQSLSDIRYSGEEEQSQKYQRLIKCCIDTLASDATLFDVNNSEILDLVETGRIWKYFSSADPMLARSSLRLAQAHIADLRPWIDLLWKELLRAGRKHVSGPGISLEVLQLMNVLTKKYPEEIWDSPSSKSRQDNFASLAQFVPADPPHSKRFWPLFYNLVLMVPELEPEVELVPLYKPLEKVVVQQLRYNLETEESAWGCFISLAGKMGPKYVGKTFIAAEQRCNAPSVPVDAISRYLSRFAEVDEAQRTVRSQLAKVDKLPFEYLLIIASTQKYNDLIASSVVPHLVANNEIQKLGILVKSDPDLPVPTLTEEDDFSAFSDDIIDGWLQIAIHSRSARSQQIVDALFRQSGVSPSIFLLSSQALSNQGVQLDLNEFVLTHLDDTDVLRAAVASNGTGFVSHSTALTALTELVKSALMHENEINALTRVIKDNTEFVNDSISENENLREGLEILASDDRRGVIRSLENLQISTKEAVHNSTIESSNIGSAVDLETWDLSVPVENIVNPLRASVPLSPLSLEEGLVECEVLAESCLSLLDSEKTAQSLGQCTIAESYLTSWLLVLPESDRQDMPMTEEFLAKVSLVNIKKSSQKPKMLDYLWSCLNSKNYALAYHAAQAVASYGPISSNSHVVKYARDLFMPEPTLKGAVLGYFSIVQNDVQYDQMQRSLIREALAGQLEDEKLMLIDRSYIPDSATLQVDEGAADHTVRLINTFTTKVSNLEELALQSAEPSVEFAAFSVLPASQTTMEAVLEFASSIPEFGSGMDHRLAQKCLLIVQEIVRDGVVDEQKMDSLSEVIDFQALLDRDDLIEIPWLCLIVPEVSQQLKLKFEDEDSAATSAHPSLSGSVLVSWILLMQTPPGSRPEISEKAWQKFWTWVVKNIDFDDAQDVALDEFDNNNVPTLPPSTARLALWLLYDVCKQYPNILRMWYRELRDKALIKQVDKLFASSITPAILRNLKETLAVEPPSVANSDAIDISINEKQREIRAIREIEDEFTVEIIVSLPEQFPCKPANVNIKNLAGVSEAKKRGWLLEARHHIQEGGVIAALISVLTHLNNFLEGVEPCAICYMTVNDLNKLPNKSCSSCHNLYHAECLYKWFTTNTNNRLCPMCRNAM